ncbi:MAG: hypothetical protein WKF77_21015, partial [Planctomycetaceae bacterium]
MIRQIPRLWSSNCDSRSRVSQRLDTVHGSVLLDAGETRLPHQPCDPDRLSGIVSQALKITAYSDAANTPANRLYQRCGFVQTTRLQLWCCDLAGNGLGIKKGARN